MRRTSPAGINLIKSFESLRLTAYQDQVGIWTIGYGHTAGVHAGQTITTDQALQFLSADLGATEAAVDSAIPQGVPQNQFDACVSLAFNIGVTAFRHSILVQLLNEGDTVGAANQFLAWDHANGKVVPGLLRRRQAEKAMFLGQPNA